ncbi:hypothetical protein KP509_16G076400 [Ceratopteris richardii]|uniref:Uncharacterized protein n=1 Tax=Ceratopteris richardii TaxID=49495 RepID=A0A8T2T019_CERRI|nr:hypothetical protein KP509_16G076400 [Ceratopteris richardii]
MMAILNASTIRPYDRNLLLILRNSSRLKRRPRKVTYINALSNQSESFVKPLSTLYPPALCRFCRGEGKLVCESCGGKGVLGKGGYHANNRVDIPRIVGSKWTAMEKTFGWRHFEVASKQKQGKDWFLELVATCDSSTRFWLNAQNLKDRERWSMGWLQKDHIMSAQNSSTVCKACKGTGRLNCTLCDGNGIKGEIISI